MPRTMRDRAGSHVAASSTDLQGGYMAEQKTEDSEIWYPKGRATGLPFAQDRIGENADAMLVHMPPPALTITIHSGDGQALVEGKDLEPTDDTPITQLTRR